MKTEKHYAALFGQLEAMHGPLDKETLTSVIGFGAGGPVSLCTNAKKKIIVTCELSLYPEQKRSAEGLKYELLSLGTFPIDLARELFTRLGNLSMNEVLGDDHTVDVSQIVKSAGPIVRFKLFSRTTMGNEGFGIYEVLSMRGGTLPGHAPDGHPHEPRAAAGEAWPLR